MNRRWKYLLAGLVVLLIAGIWASKNCNLNPAYKVGQPIDSLNGVYVYYNGGIGNVSGRNTSDDGYNLGLKYQCVEFVKRYFYEHLHHKMPDSYGHAKSFFDNTLTDGRKNEKRNLIQYTNPSQTKPEVDDLLIFGGTIFNRYGHVAIISKITDSEIEIIQQNPGMFGTPRNTFSLQNIDGQWKIKNHRIRGWLRKE